MTEFAIPFTTSQRRRCAGVTNPLVFFVMLLGCIGCWRGGDTQLAGGSVAVDGKPVSMGKVTFYPVNGGRTGSGRIQPDGTFILSYRQPGDGVPVGEYKVSIIADLWEEYDAPKSRQQDAPETDMDDADRDKADVDEAAFEVRAGTLTHVVPPKYNAIETTPLRVTVEKAGQQQQFDFDLPSEE